MRSLVHLLYADVHLEAHLEDLTGNRSAAHGLSSRYGARWLNPRTRSSNIRAWYWVAQAVTSDRGSREPRAWTKTRKIRARCIFRGSADTTANSGLRMNLARSEKLCSTS